MIIAGKSVAVRGRKVVVSGARSGRVVVRRLRIEDRRGGEGVVRWEGVRLTMEVRRVVVFEGGGGGGVPVRGGEEGEVGELGADVGSGGGERERVLATRLERRREARAGMLRGWYG